MHGQAVMAVHQGRSAPIDVTPGVGQLLQWCPLHAQASHTLTLVRLKQDGFIEDSYSSPDIYLT